MAFLSPLVNVIFLSSVIYIEDILFELQKNSSSRIVSVALAREFKKNKLFDLHNNRANQLLKFSFYR